MKTEDYKLIHKVLNTKKSVRESKAMEIKEFISRIDSKIETIKATIESTEAAVSDKEKKFFNPEQMMGVKTGDIDIFRLEMKKLEKVLNKERKNIFLLEGKRVELMDYLKDLQRELVKIDIKKAALR